MGATDDSIAKLQAQGLSPRAINARLKAEMDERFPNPVVVDLGEIPRVVKDVEAECEASRPQSAAEAEERARAYHEQMMSKPFLAVARGLTQRAGEAAARAIAKVRGGAEDIDQAEPIVGPIIHREHHGNPMAIRVSPPPGVAERVAEHIREVEEDAPPTRARRAER